MVVTHHRSKRKASGGRYKGKPGKRLHQTGSVSTMTKIAPNKRKTVRTIGGNSKTKLLTADTVNLSDPNTKKAVKAKILNVVENPANRNYIRRNILTKGAVIETDKGKARITSKPGHEGSVNAVLIK